MSEESCYPAVRDEVLRRKRDGIKLDTLDLFIGYECWRQLRADSAPHELTYNFRRGSYYFLGVPITMLPSNASWRLS